MIMDMKLKFNLPILIPVAKDAASPATFNLHKKTKSTPTYYANAEFSLKWVVQ